MVQVDLFWSYGIGASFAMAAWRQLRKLKADRNGEKWRVEWRDQPDLLASLKAMRRQAKGTGALSKQDQSKLHKLIENLKEEYEPGVKNEYFLKNLLFLSTLFVPSGSVLLWSNPSWETMLVGRYETIPQWLVGVFTTTNITQGVLGFLVTYHYLMQGKYFRACMQIVYAYFAFFFVLLNGWDKKGYRRFFSRDRESFDNWSWSNVGPWLTSDVMKILLTFGVAFLPVMLWGITKPLVEGYYEEQGGEVPAEVMVRDAVETMAWEGAAVGMIVCLAIAATVLINKLGWVKGLAALSPVLVLANSSKVGLGPAVMKKIMHVDSIEGTPV